jgi:hypothetical protein
MVRLIGREADMVVVADVATGKEAVAKAEKEEAEAAANAGKEEKAALEKAGREFFGQAAVALGIRPDPLPVMQLGETDDHYKAEVTHAKPDISPRVLEDRVRSERERVERNERLADHKQAHDDYWGTLVRRR